MADRFYGYQYDTNPRKLNTDYNPYAKRYPKQDEPVPTRTRNTSRKTSTIGTNRSARLQSDKQKRSVPEYRKKQVVKRSDNSYFDYLPQYLH